MALTGKYGSQGSTAQGMWIEHEVFVGGVAAQDTSWRSASAGASLAFRAEAAASCRRVGGALAAAAAVIADDKPTDEKPPAAAQTQKGKDSAGQATVAKESQKTTVAPPSATSAAGVKSAAAAAAPPATPVEKLPPVKGSHIADDANSCVQCHTTADVSGSQGQGALQVLHSPGGLEEGRPLPQGR